MIFNTRNTYSSRHELMCNFAILFANGALCVKKMRSRPLVGEASCVENKPLLSSCLWVGFPNAGEHLWEIGGYLGLEYSLDGPATHPPPGD